MIKYITLIIFLCFISCENLEITTKPCYMIVKSKVKHEYENVIVYQCRFSKCFIDETNHQNKPISKCFFKLKEEKYNIGDTIYLADFLNENNEKISGYSMDQ